MKYPYVSPWIPIASGYPTKDDEGLAPVVLTKLIDTDITIPAIWDENNKQWLFQEVNNFQLEYKPYEGVEVSHWMYIPLIFN